MSARQTNPPPDAPVSETDPDVGRSGGPRAQNFAPADVLGMVSSWSSLAIGVGIGLAVGLFLGWVAWPVQWVNAWPGELNPQARAHYLATVAEAYTYYGDDRAAEIARFRLFDMHENLGEEIVAAQTYFTDNPERDSLTYINYLSRLAQALNVDSPDIITTAPAQESSASPPTAVISPGLLDWLNWVVILVAAIVLIGGGTYAVYQRSKRRQSEESTTVLDLEDEEIEGFEEDEWDLPDSDGAVYRRPLAATADPNEVHPPRGAPPEGDIYFEDDETGDLSRRPQSSASKGSRQDRFADDRDLDDPEFAHRDFDDRDFADSRFDDADVDDTDDEAEFDDRRFARPQASTAGPAPRTAGAGTATAVGAVGDAAAKSTPTKTRGPGKSPIDQVATAKSRAAKPRQTPATPRQIGQYTVEFLAGLNEFEESHAIVDENGRTIAECGVGVHMRNGYLRGNPEHVLALDVFLFDKSAESQLGKNCILLSRYVVDNNLEHSFTKEWPSDPDPVIAEPKTTFVLTNPNLVMECEILSVDFVEQGDAAGIFQSLKVRMTVYMAPAT